MPSSTSSTPAELTAIAVVGRAYPRFASLDHAVKCVEEFTGEYTGKWTLESASKAGFVRLLHVLSAQEWPALGNEFRKARGLYAAKSAVKAGDLEVLRWWVDMYLPGLHVDMMDLFRVAAEFGHVHILTWLTNSELVQNCQDPICITRNYEEAARWLHQHRQVCQAAGAIQVLLDANNTALDFAFVKWIHSRPGEFQVKNKSYATVGAAANGDMMMLKWLYASGWDKWPVRAVDSAAANGHLDVIKWMFTTCQSQDYHGAATAAIVNGHSHVIDWIAKRFKWRSVNPRTAWFNRYISTAARVGNLDMVKRLFKYRSVYNPCEAFSLAASCGYIHIVQWLDANGFDSSTKAMDGAAANGCLEIVQWLHAYRREGCTTAAMDGAAAFGYLHIVKWLHDNRTEGCSTNAMDAAAQNGHMEMVQWLHLHRSEGCTTGAIVNAAANGHLDIVEWLHENRREGCTDEAMVMAASNGHLSVVEFLYRHRSTRAMDEAAVNGQLRVVQFLFMDCNLRCSSHGLNALRLNGQFEVLAWLKQQGEDTSNEQELLSEDSASMDFFSKSTVA